MSSGYLIVSTRAARGAYPVEDAVITVFCPDGNGGDSPCHLTRTDMNGITPKLELDAPDLSNVSPEQAPPFAKYRVDVDHPDYRPVTVTDVSIFSGITTALPVALIPPRSAEEQTQRIVIRTPPTQPSGSGKQS